MFRAFMDLVKRIPTPTYGNYGGFYKRCKLRERGECPLPTDDLDSLYQKHDTKQLDNWELSKKLIMIKPWKLKHPIYGTLHAYGAAALFSVISLFGVR